MTQFIAFAGDPAIQARLLARLSAHAEAGTLNAKGPRWTGVGGTPAGCIAADGDLKVFEAATGYPACLGALVDYLCQQLKDASMVAATARDWLLRCAPGADLSGVPSGIIVAVLAEPLASTELSRQAPRVAEVVRNVSDLHRRVIVGDTPSRAEWTAARGAAVSATDAASGLGRAWGELAEAAAWDPLTSRNILAEVATRWGGARGALASAETGWSQEDNLQMEACYLRFRTEVEARGDAVEATAFPPYVAAHEPELERRFVAQLERANAAHLDAGRELLRVSIACLAADTAPSPQALQ